MNRLSARSIAVGLLVAVLLIGLFLMRKLPSSTNYQTIASLEQVIPDRVLSSVIVNLRKKPLILDEFEIFLKTLRKTKIGHDLWEKQFPGFSPETLVALFVDQLLHEFQTPNDRQLLKEHLPQISEVGFALVGKKDMPDYLALSGFLLLADSGPATSVFEMVTRNIATRPSVAAQHEVFAGYEFWKYVVSLESSSNSQSALALYVARIENLILITTAKEELEVVLGRKQAPNVLQSSRSYQRAIDHDFYPTQFHIDFYLDHQQIYKFFSYAAEHPEVLSRLLGGASGDTSLLAQELKRQLFAQEALLRAFTFSGYRLLLGPIEWKGCSELGSDKSYWGGYDKISNGLGGIAFRLASSETAILYTTTASALIPRLLQTQTKPILDVGDFNQDLQQVIEKLTDIQRDTIRSLVGDVGIVISLPQDSGAGIAEIIAVAEQSTAEKAEAFLSRLEQALSDLQVEFQEKAELPFVIEKLERAGGKPVLALTVSGIIKLFIGIIGESTIVLTSDDSLLETLEQRLAGSSFYAGAGGRVNDEFLKAKYTIGFLNTNAVFASLVPRLKPFIFQGGYTDQEIEEFIASLRMTVLYSAEGTMEEERYYCQRGALERS